VSGDYQLESKPHCPNCNCLLDGATSTNKEQEGGPQAGDFSLCFDCGSALRFFENTNGLIDIRACSEEDWQEVPEMRNTMAQLQMKWRNFHFGAKQN